MIIVLEDSSISKFGDASTMLLAVCADKEAGVYPISFEINKFLIVVR